MVIRPEAIEEVNLPTHSACHRDVGIGVGSYLSDLSRLDKDRCSGTSAKGHDPNGQRFDVSQPPNSLVAPPSPHISVGTIEIGSPIRSLLLRLRLH